MQWVIRGLKSGPYISNIHRVYENSLNQRLQGIWKYGCFEEVHELEVALLSG
jgi:hypothetical protein